MEASGSLDEDYLVVQLKEDLRRKQVCRIWEEMACGTTRFHHCNRIVAQALSHSDEGVYLMFRNERGHLFVELFVRDSRLLHIA